jgi:DNA-binding NarL/FixJ family response regulator
MKLLIADAATALVPLDDSGSAGVVLVRSPTVVGALTELFDTVWDRATPYPAGRAQPAGLTPYQRQVVALLAANLKDEEIASRTHVSIRTVRRNVAAVLDHLGVTTRFAAGVQAAKRGWL